MILFNKILISKPCLCIPVSQKWISGFSYVKILYIFKSNLVFQMTKIGKVTRIYGLKIDYDDFLTLN